MPILRLGESRSPGGLRRPGRYSDRRDLYRWRGLRPPRFLAVKILKTESDRFDRFEVGLGLATETPNPDFAKSGDPWGIDRRNRS